MNRLQTPDSKRLHIYQNSKLRFKYPQTDASSSFILEITFT
jgi:hypothetical protein